MQKQLTSPLEVGGVYIHVPFCLRKCPYCDFYSITQDSLISPFLDALEAEIRLRRNRYFRCDTLYLGGGTPSLLDPAQTARVIEGVARSYHLIGGSEVTLEVNPGTVDYARIAGFRAAGVNRVNVGIQSFKERNLRFLGRIHTAEEAVRTLAFCRRAGFDNIGIDLIYGLPDQTEAEWLDDLVQAVSFRPQHLSCYMLTYEEGTPLERLRRRNRVRPLGEDRVAALFRATVAYLGRSGFHHYEVSNFAADSDRMSRHNRKYWNFQPYIGLGPSAHTYLPPIRCWNEADVGGYIRELELGKLPTAGEEILSPRQEMIEAIFLGLRQSVGISLADFDRRFGVDFREAFGASLPALEEEGLLQTTSGRCALTLEGMLFLDTVAGRLVAEL